VKKQPAGVMPGYNRRSIETTANPEGTMQSVLLTSWLAAGLAAVAGSLCLAGVIPGPKGDSQVPALPDTTPLVQEIDLDAPVEKVWQVFSTSEGQKALGVAQARIDFRIGGKMLTHYDPKGVLGDEGTIEQTIMAYEPLRMVAFHITGTPKGFPFTTAYKRVWAVATMSPREGGGTHLRFAQIGYEPDEESQRMRAFFAQGNASVMQTLKTNLGGRAGGAPGSGADGAAAPVIPAAPSDGRATSAGASSQAALAPIVVDTLVNAPPAEVWKCWTTSEGMRSFLTEAKIDLRIGGPFELYFGPESQPGQRGSEGCTILAYDPERMLSFSWNAPPTFGPLREKHTWVVVRIAPRGPDQSEVTLAHLGFAEQAALSPADTAGWAGIRSYFSQAWPQVMAALVKHFAAAARE
jgi:uncharacterized protein YndB with AHSA1/START domain